MIYRIEDFEGKMDSKVTRQRVDGCVFISLLKQMIKDDCD